MDESFTDDDRGKRVENDAGEELGTIAATDGETALIEARSSVMESVRARLGWTTDERRRVTVRADDVSERTADAIRLGIDTEAAADRQTDVDERERQRAGDTTDRPLEDEREEDLADEVTRGGDVESANRPPARDAAAIADELVVEPDSESVADTGAESSPRAPEPDDTTESSDDEWRRTEPTAPALEAAESLEVRDAAAADDSVTSTAAAADDSVTPTAAAADDSVTPTAAAASVQQAALRGGLAAARSGMTMQRQATRVVFASESMAQRASLAFATAAARGYVNALGSALERGWLADGRVGDDEARRALEATTTHLDDALAHVDDEDFARDLAMHRERVRAAQTAYEEGAPVRHERLVDLLERGADLLERCGRHHEDEPA